MQARFVLLSMSSPATAVLGIAIMCRMSYTIHDTLGSTDNLSSECINLHTHLFACIYTVKPVQ